MGEIELMENFDPKVEWILPKFGSCPIPSLNLKFMSKDNNKRDSIVKINKILKIENK